MATVTSHCKLDLFIAFTNNPQWWEIQNKFEYAQKFEHRLDLAMTELMVSKVNNVRPKALVQ